MFSLAHLVDKKLNTSAIHLPRVEQLFVGDRVYASLETVDGEVISSIDTVCE